MIKLLSSLLPIVEKILDLLIPLLKHDKAKQWRDTISGWRTKHNELANDAKKMEELKNRIREE